MASKLLVELLNSENNLIGVLKQLRYIAKVLNNQELLSWVTSEMEGYKEKDKDKISKYRILKSPCLYYSGINGHIQFSETALNLNYFADNQVRKEIENLLTVKLECPISQIEETIIDKEGKGLIIDYSFLCSKLLEDSGVIASRIYLKIPKSKLIEIENSVFNKVQDVIIELEKSLGVEKLDSLTIDLSKKEIEECNKKIDIIIKNEDSGNSKADRKLNKIGIWVTGISIIITVVSIIIAFK